MIFAPGPWSPFACSGLSSYKKKTTFFKNSFLVKIRARFGKHKSLLFYKNRSERARRKRLRADTLVIRSCTIQDAFEHPPVAYTRHILIKNAQKVEVPKIIKNHVMFSLFNSRYTAP